MKAYCVLETPPPSPVRRYLELHFSTYSQQLWGDIWRVEIETEDRISDDERIFEFF